MSYWLVMTNNASVGVSPSGELTLVIHRDDAVQLADRRSAQAFVRHVNRLGLNSYGGTFEAREVREQ